MNGLADGLGGLTGGVLDVSGDLVEDAFGGGLVVAGDVAGELFHFAEKLAAAAGDALLRAPAGDFACGAVDAIHWRGFFGVQNGEDGEGEGSTADQPEKFVHVWFTSGGGLCTEKATGWARLGGMLRDLFRWAVVFCLVGVRSDEAQRRGVPATPRDVDPALARVIAETPAIDDHAHPMLAPPAMATDREFDALPVDNMAPQTDPVAWRTDYPPLSEAWAALWGYRGKAPLGVEAQKALEAARVRVRMREGTGFPEWVLRQAGIGTMLANRVAMGEGVQPPHFLWVPYDDALLFPLNNKGLAAATPDRAQFFALEDKLRSRYLRESGVEGLPKTLKEYLRRVVTPTLERQKAGGAVAVKFEVAYLRGFDFEDVPQAEADSAYFGLGNGEVPKPVEYKKLQDFLFRYIAGECGRLGMAVHLHGMSGGGRYFSIAGVNPLLLEPLLNDERLKATNFVLLHGGWPYVREAGAMLQKPNFYLDMSQQALIFPAHALAGWLREWMETYPDKVLFGTDGYPFSAAMGWEEAEWLAARNERHALGIALTGMERDGEVTPTRAAELARMVLRGNAEALYGLKAR